MRPHIPVLGWILLGAAVLTSLACASAPITPLATRLPCEPRPPERGRSFQGTMLWGTRALKGTDEERSPRNSWVASVDVRDARRDGSTLSAIHLEGGWLVSPSVASRDFKGTIFPARASDGQRTEVAICGSEPVAGKPDQVWYQIEFWNTETSSWEDACIPTDRGLSRAMAVPGVWDAQGARHEQAGSITFACQSGVIAKCIEWGYAPWATKEGHSLAPLHQACTRMARADYCGDGQSHTVENNRIDLYDLLSIQTRSPETLKGGWAFGAAWAPDGAMCVANTRTGEDLNLLIQRDCPGRFVPSTRNLGMSDICRVERKGSDPKQAPLRNWDSQVPTHAFAP